MREVGRRGDTGPRTGLETDHVISGPMRGLRNEWGMEITQTDRQTDRQTQRHVNSMTDTAQRTESVKIYI